jgi:Tfp pilus assembly protein PilF
VCPLREEPWAPLEGDAETAVIAHLAVGRASVEGQDLVAAERWLREARELASTADLAARAGDVTIDLALVLARSGRLEEALAELERVETASSGTRLARAECQRALVLQRLGRADDALDAYRRGLAAMRRDGNRPGEARVLNNRGLLHAYARRFEAATADLTQAARLWRELGEPVQAAEVDHNLGFVAARQGDIPAALRAFEGASRSLARQGVSHPGALRDYCETLLRAHLIVEARQVGRQAMAQLEVAGMETDLAEVRLLLAEVEIAAGDLDQAQALAEMARAAFAHQNRPAWEVLARYAWLRVRWAKSDCTEATMVAAQSIAADLRRARWTAAASHARVLAARTALERGDLPVAECQLREEARHRRRAPAEVRAQAWHAEALLRWGKGDGPGAESALRAGLRAVDAYRATLGATELRVNAGAMASDLAGLGVRIALAGHEATRVLAWAERGRAATVQLTPVRPPADVELASRLAELRAINANVEESLFDGEGPGALLHEKAALETAVRRSTWQTGGFQAPGPRLVPAGRLAAALGPAVLVEYVEGDGLLHAVTVRDGACRLWSVGPVTLIGREVDSLRFSLDRLVSARGARGSGAVMEQAFSRSAAQLDDILLGPVRAVIGDRALVVVPTGPLHLLPWRALPSCRDRPVSVAPSAAVWLRAATSPYRTGGTTVVVAGPNVAHAGEEIEELNRVYPGATVLSGPRATARAVACALDGAELAHVIAHGSFRDDNPLFSSLRLADGLLTVYELERLEAAPRRVVLSSCNAGMAAVRPGNELLGLSSALFALGTSTVVASVLLVGDDETRRLMVDFHRLLASGMAPAEALAQAQSLTDPSDIRARASASSFVCYGA